eukprot:g3833.t1
MGSWQGGRLAFRCKLCGKLLDTQSKAAEHLVDDHAQEFEMVANEVRSEMGGYAAASSSGMDGFEAFLLGAMEGFGPGPMGRGGKGKGGPPPELIKPCIWLGGLPRDITDSEVEGVCSRYGSIADLNIKHSDRDTFVFVTYTRLEYAEDAIKGLDQSRAFGAGVIKAAPATRRGEGKGGDRGDKWDRDEGRGRRDDDRRRDRPRSRDRRSYDRRDGDRRREERYGSRDRGREDRRYEDRRGSNYNETSKGRDGKGRDDRDGQGTTIEDGVQLRIHLDGPKIGRGLQDEETEEGQTAKIALEIDRTEVSLETTETWASEMTGGILSLTGDGLITEVVHRVMDGDMIARVLGLRLHDGGPKQPKKGWVEYSSRREAEYAVSELDHRSMAEWDLLLRASIEPQAPPRSGR